MALRTKHDPHMDDAYYQGKREAAQKLYHSHPRIHSAYFDEDVVLGPEGFRHLCFLV